MSKKLSKISKQELLEALKEKYVLASNNQKSRILDELVSLFKCHRKHGIRLLNSKTQKVPGVKTIRRRIYNEAVKEALVVIWEASDRICSKRLKSVLPTFVEAMERHNQTNINPEVKALLFSLSASTMDRILIPKREQAGHRKKQKPKNQFKKKVPVKTYFDWTDPEIGHMEMDFVAHCGGNMSGIFIHSLVATDVNTGWVEFVPLLAREQSIVVEGLNAIRSQLPFDMLAMNSDNDSAFINHTVIQYFENNNIEFTRSRPYKKNDQAWIEQKNGSVIRRFVGYSRYSGPVAGQILAKLYRDMRLYVNFFQPSFKLLKKTRIGAKVKKTYHPPATPCDRLLDSPKYSIKKKNILINIRKSLNPMALLNEIRNNQEVLAALSSAEPSMEVEQKNLEDFLKQLPGLWKNGEVRPTHRNSSNKVHDWKTRSDPFEDVWTEILIMLQNQPDATAKSLFEKLQKKYKGRYEDGQLRTLQRRVKNWRSIIAKELVYGCIPETTKSQ